MLDISRNHWFYLEPHVYCNLKEQKSLLYSTNDGSKIAIKSEALNRLIKELHKDENYGTILLDKEQLGNELYSSFIDEAIKKRIGGVIPEDSNTAKPIRPLPILRLDNDVERYMARGDKYTGKNIQENLLAVNLYVNNSCGTNCNGCHNYYKQTTCCTVQQNESLFLSELQVERIVSQIGHSSVGRVNILGGNIFNYPHLDSLISKITEAGIEASIWSHYSQIQENTGNYREASFNILVPSSISELDLEKAAANTRCSKATFHFLVENEFDVAQAETLTSKYQIGSSQLHPIYNGSNISFFEENVFIDKDDVFYKTFSHREIFAHQKLNTNYFGVLAVLPNGDVKADINANTIGNIDSRQIIDIIHDELLQNTAWRKLRDEKPCSDCLHQFLCPSPSSYELAIGKNNLCHAYE
jgi:pseudo-rSAM protein